MKLYIISRKNIMMNYIKKIYHSILYVIDILKFTAIDLHTTFKGCFRRVRNLDCEAAVWLLTGPCVELAPRRGCVESWPLSHG